MNTVSTSRRAWWALLLVGLLTLLLAPLARAADPIAITTGAGADWGVKTSFRNYVRGPIAHGSYTTGDGASENADGTFHFPVTAGEYDPDTSATVVRFGGFVRFTGHDGQLDMRVSNPRVEITPEGAGLFADIVSKPNINGAPAKEYPGVRFARLDPTGVEPDVTGGTTTWPALPATLTEDGVEPFAGFYGVDTVLDPFAFAYDGPGGTPIAEVWTPAGTDKLGALAAGRTAAGVASIALGWDDRLWFSNYDRRTVASVDATTLETLRTVTTGFNPRNIAIDAGARAAYTIDNAILRLTEPAGDLLLDPTPLATLTGTASNELVVRQSDGAIFTLFDRRLHRYAAGGGAGNDSWSLEETGLPLYSDLLITRDGRLFLYGGGIAEVTFDNAGEAQFRAVVASPYANNIAVADDGTITWVEVNYDNYPTVVRSLHVLRRRADGGYAAPVTTPAPSLGWVVSAVAPDGSRFFVADSTNNKVQVVEDGAVVATVEGDSAISLNGIVARPDGTAFASWRDGSLKLIGRARSPTPTTQPQDAAASVAAAGATTPVTFTAAGTGSPAPTVRWQQRTAGSSRWITLAGATGETLTVDATEALSGARYRAIFTNAAGSIASQVATLAVTVTPPTPPDGGGGGGGTTPPVTPPVTVAPPVAPTPAPATTPGVTAPRGALALDRTRSATVATIACRAGATASACRVSAPKRVTVKIGGKRFALTVTAPRRVAAGKRGSVRVRLPKAAAAQLAGKRVTVKVKLTVTSGGRSVTRTVTVTLKGAEVKKTR